MESKQYQGKTLQYLAVEPDDYDSGRTYPMVLLLHGFGANMADLAGLCPAIDPVGYLYVCPNGPIPVQIGPGMTGSAWTQPRGSGPPDEASRAEEMLETLLEEIGDRYRVEPGQVVLGGFSQGAMMTYHWGLPNPEKFRGLVALSGRVSDPEGLRPRLPADRTQPIFVAHGTADSMISASSAQESKQFLEGEGYSPWYKEYPMGHEINQEVLDDLVPWIRSVLPPDRSDPA